MEQTQYNTLLSFIWNIATDVLVYAFDKREIDPQRLKLNFLEYLNGFSDDVIDIAKKLDLWHAVDRLTETDISKADSLKEERNRNFIRTFFDEIGLW
jgi:hypothetical protein